MLLQESVLLLQSHVFEYHLLIQFIHRFTAELIVQLVLQLRALFLHFSKLNSEGTLLPRKLSVALVDHFQSLCVLQSLIVNLFLFVDRELFLSRELLVQLINLGL